MRANTDGKSVLSLMFLRLELHFEVVDVFVFQIRKCCLEILCCFENRLLAYRLRCCQQPPAFLKELIIRAIISSFER
ncbi:hypothetical protein NY2A_b703R [Paramecium bursaria Chlorella virus NY2A]|uniref:Uncharacterized protein b703R n=1 Tax=Paramecium bursaria Chlorella virus NY2A TaxID=46021 RepID=A7IXM8_PBCVN|nr:hypothetical protein NY2A_b703R [Paramecium bursaria Chlorella virus NY2A]YP_001498718.1 hypothetical protein AR158_c637R [Paramecium bursaria Chlorella virus AR158]ABT15102.1 hypothetical protein NY2A_b703R [Paramecium bursaria Chlorella virus NY2A]ABU44182.1 hypothetical protein AR158_c637R [Paramecium bursaria Chlorella virus AR158]